MFMNFVNSLLLFSASEDQLFQGTTIFAGIPWYIWLLIFVVVVLFLWWRLSASAAKFDEESPEFDKQLEEQEPAEESQEQPEEEQEPVEEPQEQPEEEQVVEKPAMQPEKPDDLTKIEGIGPKINILLNEAGIATYSQLASADSGMLEEIITKAGLHMVNVSTWQEQAALAADGKWDELATLQEELKGGRRVED